MRRRICTPKHYTDDHDSSNTQYNDINAISKVERCYTMYKRPYIQWISIQQESISTQDVNTHFKESKMENQIIPQSNQ